ncbi:unnamed protein product [Lactuca saligna]|uniref:ABC transporter domain-containing protein n=1 Tax=Lactuca saligna TaxID=75948 RepID=A0AA36EES4_LACSI|nr:unnamed protein product [Lactuca saligna]
MGLMSRIGLVTQEPALLSLSIRDNIAYGRDVTSLQVEDATKTAHAHTFISSLEKGYDTQVGRAGLSLAEEQKIRLSVARVVLSNPCILLLDEVTGGLDFEAERSVQEALDLLMVGRSTIIIGRRLSSIKNADFYSCYGGRMPARTPNETSTFQIEKDSTLQESSSPKFTKSPSLQQASNLHTARSPDSNYNSYGSQKKIKNS